MTKIQEKTLYNHGGLVFLSCGFIVAAMKLRSCCKSCYTRSSKATSDLLPPPLNSVTLQKPLVMELSVSAMKKIFTRDFQNFAKDIIYKFD